MSFWYDKCSLYTQFAGLIEGQGPVGTKTVNRTNKGRFHMLRNFGISAIASFCLLFSMAVPAMAQEGTGRKITNEELEKAAEAYVEIAMISEEFQQNLQQTNDDKERQKIQQKANERMIKAVEEADLDVETYNKVMGEVSKDEELSKNFNAKVQEVN